MTTSEISVRDAESEGGRGRVPLSESDIWDRLARYYEHEGVRAWSGGAVPSYITSNAFVARSYAHVVLGHLLDLHARGEIDPSRPVYVVELGAGHGRFSYHLVRTLQRLLEEAPLPKVRLRYVMTDLAESNLADQAEHPLLRELFDSGVLDQARFDCETDTHLDLRRAGERIGPDTPAGNVVVLANYVLDSLRQDAFRVRDGVLDEGLVTVVGGAGDGPPALRDLALSYEHVPTPSRRYGEPRRDGILEDYSRLLADSSFGFPVGAVACLDRLRALCSGPLLLLSADKGFVHLDELVGLPDPQPAFHGSISFMVNYHALGEYVRLHDGHVYRSALRDAPIVTLAFLLDGDGGDWPATALAFREHVESFGPADFHALSSAVTRLAGEMSMSDVIAALRLSNFDPQMLFYVASRLLDKVGESNHRQRRELREVLARCWENHFPLGESHDLPFEIARLHSRMDGHRDALRFYRYSLELFGEHRTTHHNMGVCRHALGEVEEALVAFDRALTVDPGYSSARSWRLRLLAERGDDPSAR